MAAAKRKKGKTGSGWSWRLAGIALCAFFVLGVITGLSQSGRLLAHRIQALLQRLPYSSRSQLLPTAYHALFKEPTAGNIRRSAFSIGPGVKTDAIAVAERPEGFYQVDSQGGLFGPLSPAEIPDLPILSGSGIQRASASQLMEYAANVIRAEAVLGVVISEMRVVADGDIRLCLDRPHVVIVLTRADFALQLSHAAKVLQMWHSQQQLIEVIDVRVPGEAIVRPKAEAMKRVERAGSELSSVSVNALKGQQLLASHY